MNDQRQITIGMLALIVASTLVFAWVLLGDTFIVILVVAGLVLFQFPWLREILFEKTVAAIQQARESAKQSSNVPSAMADAPVQRSESAMTKDRPEDGKATDQLNSIGEGRKTPAPQARKAVIPPRKPVDLPRHRPR